MEKDIKNEEMNEDIVQEEQATAAEEQKEADDTKKETETPK